MSKIDEVTDKIIEAVANGKWSAVDRLQLILEQLVKIEIASIQGKILPDKTVEKK